MLALPLQNVSFQPHGSIGRLTPPMKLLLKIVGAVLLLLVLAAGGFYLWASTTSSRLLARTFEIHGVDFPVPFPLSEQERQEPGLTDEEVERLATERAVERGKHLVEARYACLECHGADFSGGVMVDAAPIGRLLGPNITSGRGSRAEGFGPSDWDRIVRHGVRSDGRPAAMPAGDYQLMADQELSDIIAYLSTQPAVDNEVPAVTLGPLGKILMATGQFPLSVDLIQSHDAEHTTYPPAGEVSVEFGRHLAGICTGCHQEDFAGGQIPGADPSWVPARNLTPHADGLRDWSYEQFVAAMLEGRRPHGTEVLLPMTLVMPYAQRMTEVELEALWTYLGSLSPLPSRQ